MKTEKYNVTGMTCAACQANVTRCVSKLEGVEEVNVSLLANQMTVSYDEAQVSPETIVEAVEKIGYGASSLEKQVGPKSEKQGFRGEWQSRQEQAMQHQKEMKRRLIASVALLVPLMYIAMGHMLFLPVPWFFVGEENSLVSALVQLILTVPVLFINRRFFQTGLKALWHRAPNMDSLVAIGSGASLVYGLFAMFRLAYGFGHGDMEVVHQYAHALYFESAAMILTLVTVGKYLEAKSKSKTGDALGKLVDLAPKTAVVIRNGQEHTVPAEEVVAGDIVVIRPGEGIPVDGVVTEGHGYVDQAAITGESIPVEKGPGDQVISATINKNGSFRFRASKVGEDTTLSQIIRLVDEASNSKAPIARLADKVSGVFVPVVIGIALVTAIVWMVAGMGFEFALSNAISVLVISCPCALGLATPVAIMVGTGKAAEMGILIKSAESLENLHNVDTIVLDKTGTITSGHPSVTDVLVLDSALSEREFLAEAAAVEQGSEHPLAQAVVEFATKEGASMPQVESFDAVPGRGVSALVDGRQYLAGNLAYLRESGMLSTQEESGKAEREVERFAREGKTPLLFARDGKLVGIIAVADTVRETSRAALARFREMGLHVVMLTGDNGMTAEAIRKELGIEKAVSDVLPTEKESHIRALQEGGHKVAMVGDGINDAPALTRADIGIAIGAGTDIAIESADVVLMKDSLEDVAAAIDLSKAVVRNIHMNLFWAFFYNVLGIPLAAGALFPAFGLRLSPMIGSAAMSLSSVCVVTNALRLRFFKRKSVKTEELPPAMEVSRTAVQNQPTVSPAKTEPEQKKGMVTMKKVLIVDGMMCAHCQAHVQKALAGVEGVSEAVVDLENKKATVTLSQDVADQVLMDAVTEAGYTPVSCEAAE
jgi:Cu+-exporting ATPase